MKRQFLLILSTIGLGATLTSIVLYFDFIENIDLHIEDNRYTNIKILEKKINGLSEVTYKPLNFSCLIAEIHSSQSNGLITKSAEENLLIQLKNKQIGLLVFQCEKYLMGLQAGSTSTDLRLWLTDYLNFYPNVSKASHYKAQIARYDYYAMTLPDKVDVFIKKTCYDSTDYRLLTAALDNIPSKIGIDNKYQGSPILRRVKLKKIDDINKFYVRWYNDEIEDCIK